jgi:predicted nucleic acid-binding protein
LSAGVRVFVAEIVDYEVRRELLRVGPTSGLRRLNQVKATCEYAPLTTDIMLKAAELWAMARGAGLVTAPPEALDGDVILTAQALLAVSPGDVVTVATDNVRHFSHFVDAQPWEQITA